MTLQTRKRLLNVLAGGIVVLSVVVLWQGISAPMLPEATVSASNPSAIALKQTSETATHPLAAKDIEVNWNVLLRRPLYDPPAPPPRVIEKPSPQPLRVKLIATVVEPGNSTAMLQLAGGQVVFRRVGEEIGPDEGGAKIVAIESGSVRVDRGEETLELKVEGRE